ncbi:SDR family NAD(P)-dependent oxidoreductase [Thermoflexus sp.]|uniref:SDR family NAD(P)-dependent oxidoreductase n=2 Tax=Thermoflexus sp. TaxID=1969742 RepID=UPI0025E4083B|nr:glucose 1-dehydrogenase [Thermoflexus sp.]MCS7350774.1 glucose 1-dehydrogenase [Thermoflexus sp.]MCX7689858.1 glucose 1-dehydrogenase [Thermoflexus sp.]MDW8065939.1 glucose 1-dehydrogenase [Anaerolineae bacterium]MDW8180225.1 glucose 1-dehydrogenase [Anaerolineae bacterium]
MRLKDKVAIVTGGAMGIGKGIVTVFAREGAKVVIADINEVAGQETEKELRDQGFEAFFVRCDVSNEEDVKAMIQKTIERYGALHILVNNAGIGVYKSITEATREEFERCLAVNLVGPFLCSKYAIPHIKASGGGSIINIASVHSVQNVGGTAPYAASKGGLAALTRAAAIDVARDNIRVNAICPGWIDTPLVRGIFASSPDPEGMRRQVERRQLLGRLGTPEDVGYAALFLASDESSYVTGSLLFVDAGMTAQLETW